MRTYRLIMVGYLILTGCTLLNEQSITATALSHYNDSAPELLALVRINAEVNETGHPCPLDYCNAGWPLAEELVELEYWDCKAYAVSKARRLLDEIGFSHERLEYIIIEGPSLRVAHAALLVDGRILLDSGTLCRVCTLDDLDPTLQIMARLPVAELEPLIRALRLGESTTVVTLRRP